MKVERFDPGTDSASVRACHDIYLSGLPDDDPPGPPMSPRAFAGWLALGWTEDPLETWLARDDSGEPCGWYALNLPQRENRQLAGLSLMVHAARRRAGRGTRCSGTRPGGREAGRTVLETDALEDSPGAAFAGTLKARPSVTAVQRVLALADLPAEQRAALRAGAEAAARGYTVATWDGPAPEDTVDEVAALNGAMADAPREAGQEAQAWDAARVRLDERRIAAMGVRAHVVAARAPGTGDLAALTQVCVDPAMPEWGFQELTAVARPHRGHRLGLLVKLAMLDRLAAGEPQVTRIVTRNADGNQHMIAINEQLGFRVLSRWPSWELDVADVPPICLVMADREIRVSRCGPGQVPSAAEVELLYYAATCGRPLRESRATAAGYARLYAALLRRPDLEAVAARASGGQLAGFAYGHGWRWAEQADDWAAQLQERLGGAAGLLDGRFAVYLLAVHPWYRRAGLGRQLLQTLLSATKTGAWLITRDEPTPAMALYQREGWEPIGHGPDTCDARPGLVLTHP